ncbi:hypothetical protein M0L20_18165 [Spirosoma sp. RP8]|uniref:Uncharacterized protein n=1 Tax=Spirosoma liriopis TaxID=2937440 RepID=A0ABT0HNU9_9BACT|nr:hypothetical protein [Spirosoma liriopis]MCK8493797.1 hypothetical protein [Spirosoma liriopis]
MDTIQTPISDEPVTSFKRIARHENFNIGPDLNMVQQVRVITVDASGQPLTERIQADQTLTTNQQQAGMQRYADQIVTRQTMGAFVDATGQVVAEGTESAMPQLDYFQGITLGDLKKKGMTINDKTPFASLLYALLTGEILNIDARSGL